MQETLVQRLYLSIVDSVIFWVNIPGRNIFSNFQGHFLLHISVYPSPAYNHFRMHLFQHILRSFSACWMPMMVRISSTYCVFKNTHKAVNQSISQRQTAYTIHYLPLHHVTNLWFWRGWTTASHRPRKARVKDLGTQSLSPYSVKMDIITAVNW